MLWMKTSGWYDVKKWVLSFGTDARVLEPVHLRDGVKNEVKKMHKDMWNSHSLTASGYCCTDSLVSDLLTRLCNQISIPNLL